MQHFDVAALPGQGNLGLALVAIWGLSRVFVSVAPLMSDRVADRAIRLAEAKRKSE